MGIKEVSVGRSDEFKVPLDQIQIEPGWNARDLSTADELEAIKELAQQMVGVGIIKPLMVVFKNDRVYVRDGHRRLTAAHYANKHLGTKIAHANCVTLPRGAAEEDYLLLQVLEDKSKSPMEVGGVYKRLIGECGMTEAGIAARVGKSITHVSTCLDLQAAPLPIKNAVKSGAISSTLAAKVIKDKGAEATKTVADAIDAAHQQGKTRATAKHIGQEPKKPKANPLTRVRELFGKDEGTTIDETRIGVTVTFSDENYAELSLLLDLDD